MVAEDQSTPMPDKDDPWTKEVGEEDGGAVGGEDAEQQAGPVGDQRVGMGAVRVGPCVPHCHDVDAVDLIDPDQRRAG